jgi:hypothetical protein
VEPAQEVAKEQEAFDPERAMKTIKELRQFEKLYKQTAKQLDEIKAKEDEEKQAQMTEAEKLKAQLDKTERELVETRKSVMLQEVAREIGLPDKIASRLQGSTREELIADAQSLLEAITEFTSKNAPAKQTAAISPTNPANAQQGETDAQRRARLQGRGANIFSPEGARKAGGGVIFSKQE